MILDKIKDLVMPTKIKTDILYQILQDKSKIDEIKYLSVGGYAGNTHPDDAYKLINAIQEKYNIKEFNYGYWDSGCMVFNSIEIINGECKIGVEYK